jgi:acetyltransferase-like isoleucine patch superfamily enzyme
MTKSIHPSAIISDSAEIGDNVEVGPYAVIGGASIGSNCVIHSHVVIADGVRVGQAVEVFPGAVLGREPKGAGATARKPEFSRKLEIGDECSIGPHVIVYYDVLVGSNTLLGDGASIREKCVIGDRCIISRFVSINYSTVIGHRTKIMDGAHITGNMKIGNDVFIGPLVSTANDNLIRAGYADHIIGPAIEDYAFLGAGAILLPGTQIGRHAVVAAGAVVSRSVDAYAVVAGVPAKFVRDTRDENSGLTS